MLRTCIQRSVAALAASVAIAASAACGPSAEKTTPAPAAPANANTAVAKPASNAAPAEGQTPEAAAMEKQIEEALVAKRYGDVTVEVKGTTVNLKGKMRPADEQKAIRKVAEDIAFPKTYSVNAAFST